MVVKEPSRAHGYPYLTFNICRAPGLGRLNPSEDLHSLGPYSTFKGKGKTQGLKTGKSLFFL